MEQVSRGGHQNTANALPQMLPQNTHSASSNVWLPDFLCHGERFHTSLPMVNFSSMNLPNCLTKRRRFSTSATSCRKEFLGLIIPWESHLLVFVLSFAGFSRCPVILVQAEVDKLSLPTLPMPPSDLFSSAMALLRCLPCTLVSPHLLSDMVAPKELFEHPGVLT